MDVHVHANCQAIPIAGMLREAYPDWNVTWFEAHGPEIINRFDEHCARIKSADLVISQPIHAGYRGREELSVDWVRANIRSGATLLVFPSLHFSGHHPGLDGLALPSVPFLSNLLAAHLVACGFSPEQTVQLLLSEDLLRDTEIEREIHEALEETRRREVDDRIDILISPYLNEHCRTRTMFHIQNHPLRETSAYIANGILERLGYPGRVSVEGQDYQKDTHIPPLPSVARFLRKHRNGDGSRGPDEIVLMPTHPPMTQADYYTMLVQQLAAAPANDVIEAVARRWPTIQVLRRLAAQGSDIPGISRWLQS
jgi:hypothetical protein